MLKWSTCCNGLHVDHYAGGFWRLLVEKSFLSKVEGMNDRGIMRTFHLGFCLNLRFKGVVVMVYIVVVVYI